MNIFSSLKIYATKWQEKGRRSFSPEEIAMVKSAVVVSSQYGASVEFQYKKGGKSYIPLSQDATLTVGETVKLSKAVLITLHKEGEDDIYRVGI